MPSTGASEEKARLRAQVRARLEAMDPGQLRREDELMFAAFCRLPQLRRCGTVFLFWGMGREPDTARLVRAVAEMGKQVALPRVLSGRRMELRRFSPQVPLIRHPFGMLEPGPECPLVPPEEIGLALVPALCYDREGYRLGFGGGYYDRWLAQYGGFTVGLCRQALLADRLPREGHDRPVRAVITPQGVLFPPHSPCTAESGAQGPAL